MRTFFPFFTLSLVCLSLFALKSDAGFPPTTSQGIGDSSGVVTFNYQFPNFAITHSGPTASLGVLGIGGGGTGNTSGTAVDFSGNLLGDVTSVGMFTTIASHAVTNSKMAQMATLTLKGNDTGITADPQDLSVSEVQTMLGTSGTNTGDVTLSPFGTVPNSNAASLTGQALTLQPADATHPGGLSILSQSIAGNKTMTGVTGLLLPATSTETLLQSDIRALGSYVTDTATAQVQPAGIWNTVIGSVITSGAQVAGQTRGAVRINLSLQPTAGTTYGGNYRGMQFTSSNFSANVTGTLTAGTFNASTLSGATTARQVGALFTSVNSSGVLQNSTGVDISSSQATGTDTIAHAAIGIRLANTAITASGSSLTNTATGIEIRNNITATGTGATAYAINSLSTAQSVFAGSLTAASLTTGGNLSVSGKPLFGGTSPTLSGCGTSPSIVGNDKVGRITVGTGGIATSCTVTFNTAWTNAPICMANNETTILLAQASATTTVLTITSAVAFTASDTIGYHCLGYF